MCKFKIDKKEQLCCIRPKNKKSRKDFWIFRCKQTSDTLLYLAVLQGIMFLLELLVDFPTSFKKFQIKSISSLWSLLYIIYWLLSLKFPKHFAYFLPLHTLLMGITTMFYFVARVKDMSEKEGTNI